MDQKELNEILADHAKWQRGEGGKRANLSGATLSGATLRGANLSGVNLSGATLRGADLSWADLRWADLSWADLSWDTLSGADLRWADLRWATLRGADLRSCIGDGKIIRTMQLHPYVVTVCDDWLQIGCQGHRVHDWCEFKDEYIAGMDDGALEWWRDHKALVMAFVDADGCGEE